LEQKAKEHDQLEELSKQAQIWTDDWRNAKIKIKDLEAQNAKLRSGSDPNE